MELDLQAPMHAIPEELGVHPGLGPQDDPLADRQTDSTTHQVVRQLDHGSRSKLARIDNRVAE